MSHPTVRESILDVHERICRQPGLWQATAEPQRRGLARRSDL